MDKVAEGNLARKMPEGTDMDTGEGKARPCLLLCCCAKALTKSNWGRMGLFGSQLTHSPSRETEAGIEAETKEGCSLLLIQLLFLYSPTCPGMASPRVAHSGLGPSTSILRQENAPQMCSQANLMEAIPQFSSFFKLTNTIPE